MVTGFDGTVLVTISRHTEFPNARGGPEGSGDAPLVVVDVVGDIDTDTSPMLQTALSHAIRRNPQVCCDLSQVAFLGAAAVNTIFAALADADQNGCVFTVRGVHGFGARVFQVTGLTEFLAART
jgi:anti-anti-sigma factor